MKVQGRFTLLLKNPGKPREFFYGKNLVVAAGESLLAQILETNNGSVSMASHVGVGTSGTAVDPSQTDLQAPSAVVARAALVESRLGNVLSYAGTIVAGASDEVVRELGIFNAAVAGTMLARFLPTVFTLEIGGTLDVVWALEIGG